MVSDEDNIQRQVRQRERFICAYGHDNEAGLMQYAHIVPDADGGAYEAANLLWAHEQCQRKFEAARKPAEQKAALIKIMEEVRDQQRQDSFAEGIFDELVASGEDVEIKMGAVSFGNVRRPFAEHKGVANGDAAKLIQYLEFVRDGHRLVINGLIKGDHGRPLISFQDSKLRFYTGDAWDFERKAGYLKIINQSQQIWITIQRDNDTVKISGQLYFGHERLSIDQAVVSFGGRIFMQNVRIVNGGTGLGLPFTEWRPVGHVRRIGT